MRPDHQTQNVFDLHGVHRSIAVARPRAFVLLTTRRFDTERSLAVLEEILAPYAEAGFDSQMTARLFRLGGYFVGGAGHAEIASRGQAPDATPIVMRRRPLSPRSPTSLASHRTSPCGSSTTCSSSGSIS